MSSPATRAVQALLNRMGYAIHRLPRDSGLQFAPKPEDRLRWLQRLGIRTVLDVGAHTGESAEFFAKLFPDAAIYSFEPIAECFRSLQRRMAGHTNHRAFPFALGDMPGRAEIHRSAYAPSSSLLEMAALHKEAYPFTAGGTTESIDVETLDGIASTLKLVPPVLLKIDTQGFELKVLSGAEHTLAQIAMVIVEASFDEMYLGQPLFPDVYRWLERRGFVYRGSSDQFHDPRDGRPLQQDGIFVRVPRG